MVSHFHGRPEEESQSLSRTMGFFQDVLDFSFILSAFPPACVHALTHLRKAFHRYHHPKKLEGAY